MKERCVALGVLLILVLIVSSINAQVVESEWSTIHINNKKVRGLIENVDSIPPVLDFISPKVRDGESFKTEYEEITLIGKVTDESGVPTMIVNSKNILPNSNGLFKEKYRLKRGINTFKFVAMDSKQNLTEKTLIVEYKPTDEYTEQIEVEGNYYALLIAVEEYQNPKLYNLQNPVKDANTLKNVLTQKYLFEPDNILLLENPTWDKIMNSFDLLSRTLTPDDNLFVFYAGHGWWDEEANIGYWLPSDADKVSKTRWVRNSTLQDYLKEIKARHMLLVTDACFSGSIFNARSISAETSIAIKKLYDLPSRKAMTSGSLTEVPDESIFVKYFIDRLVNNDKHFLSAEQLFSSFRIAVINNSEVLPQYGVIKNVGDEGGDFIFILRNP